MTSSTTKRRRFLKYSTGVLSCTVAGCLSGQATEPNIEAGSMEIRNASTDHSEVGLDVGFVRRSTDESPAKVEISVSNTGLLPKVIGFGPSPPFSDYTGASKEGPRMYLVPDDTTNVSATTTGEDGELVLLPNEKDGRCWRSPARPVGEDLRQDRVVLPDDDVAGRYSVTFADGDCDCGGGTSHGFEDSISIRRDGTDVTLRFDVDTV